MKCILFALLSLNIFIGCSKPATTLLPELVHAESLMSEHPDSALILLDSMHAPSSRDKLQYATWCLLLTQARDKNYVKHTSDSLINTAFAYFNKQDDLPRKATSLYYKGRVNNDLHNAKEATSYYLKAKKIAKKTNNCTLLSLICSNLGMLYAYQGLNDEALPTLQEAHGYAVQTNDSVSISFSLIELARVYGAKKDWDNSIRYYEEAMLVAAKSRSFKTYCFSLSEIAAIYNRIGQFDLSISYLKKSENTREKSGLKESHQAYLGLGHSYLQAGISDSAFFYLNKSLQTDNLYTRRSASLLMSLLFEKQEKYKEAVTYNKSYRMYSDSINKITKHQEIAEIQAKYNHEKLQNEKNQLKIENANLLKTGLIIFVLILSVTGIITFSYQRKLLKKERDLQKNKEEMRSHTIKLLENQAIILSNEELINTISEQLEGHHILVEQAKDQEEEVEAVRHKNELLQNQNKQLQTDIDKYAQFLLKKNNEMNAYETLMAQNRLLLGHEKYLSAQLIKRIEILNQIKHQPKYIMEEQWSEVLDAVNNLSTNFAVRLRVDFPFLTESDLQLCCLIKLRMSNSDIAISINVKPTSVTKRKQRIKEHLNQYLKQPLAKEQSIDAYFWTY